MYFKDLNIYDFSQDFITTDKKSGKKLNPSQTLTDDLMVLPSTGIRRCDHLQCYSCTQL